MSIALDNISNNRIEGSGFIRGLSCMIFESSEKSSLKMAAGIMKKNIVDDDADDELGYCSSSSIGRNSESDDDDEDDSEVQSSYKGPLDNLDALQDCLPIKRGISQFYSGKSKSFTSLADASSASIKEIAKPENAYTRKRKNLIATSIMMDKSQNKPLQRSGSSISKRLTSSSRLLFSPTGTPTSSSESITSEHSNTSSSSSPSLPPLHPRPKPSSNNAWTAQPSFSSRRAFSLADLQIANESHSSSINNKDENKKDH